eukprot:TRINITY_DN2129_c0_g1_i7.p1 TRINITY_DN2129_c0_g1~~TRINITY_DN2129_c0_g1_i7.p1  ORF type:complete len:453 (+),score=106.60 TRINITY_DN2129_c0_g1_i7:132-1490(+)
MIRRPPRSTLSSSSAASDVYKRQVLHEGTDLHYIAEQVSHHPPITASYAECREAHIVLEGSVHTKCTYWVTGTVGSIMNGGFRLTFTDRQETYELTMPNVLCKGLLIGKLRTELSGETYIRCSQTGLQLKFKYKEKPFMGGKMNGIEGRLLRRGCKEPLYSLKGRWDTEVLLTHCRTQEVTKYYSIDSAETVMPRSVGVWDQRHFESQRVWFDCVQAIELGDHRGANQQKLALEDAQRKRQKERDAGQRVKHVPRFFELDTSTGGWMYRQFCTEPGAGATLQFGGSISAPPGSDPWEEEGEGTEQGGVLGACCGEDHVWDEDDNEEEDDFHDCNNEFVGVAISDDKIELISRSSSMNSIHNVSYLNAAEAEHFFTPRTSLNRKLGGRWSPDMDSALSVAAQHFNQACALLDEGEPEQGFCEFQEAVRIAPDYDSWCTITAGRSFPSRSSIAE